MWWRTNTSHLDSRTIRSGFGSPSPVSYKYYYGLLSSWFCNWIVEYIVHFSDGLFWTSVGGCTNLCTSSWFRVKISGNMRGRLLTTVLDGSLSTYKLCNSLHSFSLYQTFSAEFVFSFSRASFFLLSIFVICFSIAWIGSYHISALFQLSYITTISAPLNPLQNLFQL